MASCGCYRQQLSRVEEAGDRPGRSSPQSSIAAIARATFLYGGKERG
jgi:hypothetical protein